MVLGAATPGAVTAGLVCAVAVWPAHAATAANAIAVAKRHGAKAREDGRLIWKRDPAILKGFVPTELWRKVLKIQCPIVYVLGGLSAIVPPQTQQELQAKLRLSQIVMMPGLGHYPSDEKPDEFLAIVTRFLAGVRA